MPRFPKLCYITPQSYTNKLTTTTTTTAVVMSNAATFNHRNILSYNGNIMLAAIIALLLVILFVLLLHMYARWFLSTARNHIPRSTPHVITTRFHSSSLFERSSEGLDSSVIASLPLFVYMNKHACNKPECVICLSVFEDEQVGRKLPNCCHVFHVECIDMWLYSHSTCPICRHPVIYEGSLTVNGEFPTDIVAIQISDHENAEVGNLGDSLSTCPPSSSLKRTTSKNILDHKIHPSSNL